MRWNHPSQRCISSRQMTDNILRPQESSFQLILLSQCQSFLDFLRAREHIVDRLFCRFLRSIHSDSTTHEFAGAVSFWPEEYDKVVLRVVSFFAMAFDPIFRWLQESITPRNPDNLEFLQPAQCACVDDLAVASFSFQGLMTALAPAFRRARPSSAKSKFGQIQVWPDQVCPNHCVVVVLCVVTLNQTLNFFPKDPNPKPQNA